MTLKRFFIGLTCLLRDSRCNKGDNKVKEIKDVVSTMRSKENELYDLIMKFMEETGADISKLYVAESHIDDAIREVEELLEEEKCKQKSKELKQ